RRNPEADHAAPEGRAGPGLLRAESLGRRRAGAVGSEAQARGRGPVRQGAGQPLPARNAADPVPRRQGSGTVHMARGAAATGARRPDDRVAPQLLTRPRTTPTM